MHNFLSLLGLANPCTQVRDQIRAAAHPQGVAGDLAAGFATLDGL